jgi:hypothetical protein
VDVVVEVTMTMVTEVVEVKKNLMDMSILTVDVVAVTN